MFILYIVIFIFFQVKFVNPQVDPDKVSLMSVEGTVSSNNQPKVAEPLPTPAQDIEDSNLHDSNDTISGRTKSISEQLSKVDLH